MKPYVICHMMPSVDGRLRTDRWDIPASAMDEYDRTAETFRCDAWLAGRKSMESLAKGSFRHRARAGKRIPREDFVVPREKGQQVGVALDARGKLAWKRNTAGGDPLIVIVGEDVSDAYLEALRDQAISYLFAGRRGKLDLKSALTKLRTRFGIRRLILEGGGTTNGSFLKAGLIDEVSVLLMPVADGGPGEPALFDVADGPARAIAQLSLKSFRRVSSGVLWIRYTVRRARRR
ncbi:MAG TPA: RibD family protein [Gemmatimonadales bacterium]|jgi:riboflavin biosynthesis pyrimidine reductase